MFSKESIDKFLNIEKLAAQYNVKYFNIKLQIYLFDVCKDKQIGRIKNH